MKNLDKYRMVWGDGGFMKKRIVAFIMSCLVVLSFSSVLYAKDATPRVVDDAALLTKSEVVYLEELIDEIASEYDVDVVLVTTTDNQGKTLQQYAEDYYKENEYGYGKNNDGMIFLVSMETLDWWIGTKGVCIDLMTDARYTLIEDNVLPFLSKAQYNKAFVNYLTAVNGFLSTGLEDVKSSAGLGTTDSIILSVVISIIIGLFVSWLITFIQKRKMYSAIPEIDPMGEELHIAGEFKLQVQEDTLGDSDVSKAVKVK